MTDLVVDASAYVYAMTHTGDVAEALRTRIVESDTHAPHLIDAEVGNVLRKREIARDITPLVSRTALHALPHLIGTRYPHTGHLAALAWDLRKHASFYDALYVAVATALQAPLVTLDARLSRAPKLPCRVDLVTAP